MSNNNSDHYFLRGGGEMGELIRAKDWSKTALGDPKDWPDSLRTMVAVMLDNPFGMYIAWGSEHIQLYNDGYRPILGATKHPQALGISTRETFSEIWHIIGSMFDGVMKGKAVGFPDFMLPLNRNGFVEECYFDFSYSPIRKNDGEVGGVLVTVVETTNKKKTDERLKESNERFRNTMRQAPVGITILRGPEYIVEMANDAYLQLVGKKEADFVGKPLFTSLPEVEEAVHPLLDNVLNTGVPYHGSEAPIPVNRYGKQEVGYFDFLWHPLKEEDGRISGVIATVNEVTDKVITRKKIEESEQRFRLALAGINQIVFSQDKNLIHTWIYSHHPDFKQSEIIGKSDKDLHVPESAAVLTSIKQKVLDTGNAFNGDIEIEIGGKKVNYTLHIEAIKDSEETITGGAFQNYLLKGDLAISPVQTELNRSLTNCQRPLLDATRRFSIA